MGMSCKICFERDGVVSHAVTEHLCTNGRTGKQFLAHVCKRCLDGGRETRVTCQMFVEETLDQSHATGRYGETA